LCQNFYNHHKLLTCGGLLLGLAAFLTIGPLSVPERFTYQIDVAKYHEPGRGLHNMYLACHAYWNDSSPQNDCTVNIASQATYGFIQDKTIDIVASGNKSTFSGKANSKSVSSWATIDATREISREIDYGFNWYEKFLNSLGIYDRPY